MRGPLSAAIAWRYLWSKKSHGAVGTISTVSVCAMAVAVAAIVCVLSVFNGFRSVIAERLDSLSPDVEITPAKGKVLRNARQLADSLAMLPEVEVASPVLSDNALVIFDSKEMPVTLKGVVPEEYERITGIRHIIRSDEGSYLTAYNGPGSPATIAIGTAVRLGAPPGSRLLLFAPRREGRINPANPASSFVSDSVWVSGIYRSEQAKFDDDGVIVPIDVARFLLQYSDEASGIEVRTTPRVSDAQAAGAIRKALGPGFTVKDRLRQQEVNFRMISIEKWVSFLLLFFILVIASFNLISSLSMLVIEKESGMATLRALGLSRNRIGWVFAWESIYVSLAGGLAGIILGIALCLLQQFAGIVKIGGTPGATVITAYPVEVQPLDILITLCPVAVIGLFTALITFSFARSRV